MKYLVVLSAVLFCVSSVPLEAEYGVPAAPVQVVVEQPIPVQVPVPVHTVQHPAQFFHHATAPVAVSVASPVHVPAPFVAPVRHVAPIATFAPVPQAAAVAPVAAIAPVVAPVAPVTSSQFHAQDEFGQVSFGYENINSARQETRDAFGVTRGSYQYVDANGVLQTTHYVADPINGFQVAATNIPVAVAGAQPALPVGPVAVQETAEVAAARAEHLAAHEAAQKRLKRDAEAQFINPIVSAVPNTFVNAIPSTVVNAGFRVNALPTTAVVNAVQTPVVHAAPAAFVNPIPVHTAPAPIAPQPVATSFAAVAPVIAAAPAVTSSQFHAQDEFGQVSFGYENPNSARQETRDAFGVTRGSYQYVDANGVLQTTHYVADPINGFQVAATNIPVAVAGAQPILPVGPVAVEPTPEVVAATADHLAVHAAAKQAALEV